MNIQMQVCGLCIMLLLLFFCLRQRSLWINTEKMFLRTLIVAMICVCMDILSIVAITNRKLISNEVLAFICKTYLVSLVMVGFCSFVYTNLNLEKSKEQSTFKTWLIAVVSAVAIALIYILPIYYFRKGTIVYTFGPSVVTTYVFALLWVVLTMYTLFSHCTEMSKKRFGAILAWMVLWGLASVIQGLNNELLLVGFATSLGMVILFFELENPEANRDRKTGAFNSHALLEYMGQKYESNAPFCVLAISLENSHPADRIMKEVVTFLDGIANSMLFKRVNREFVLTFEDKESLESALLTIRERFRSEWGRDGVNLTVMLEPLYMVLPDSSVVDNAEEILRIFSVCRTENETQGNSSIIYINDEVVDRKREQDMMAKTIQHAIADDRVEVFYQPIYSVRKQKFVSAEALVRIRKEDGSILPPGKFIPVAEANGSIRQLGEIVFEKTCKFIKNYHLEQYGVEYIEVNLSVEQCESRNLAERYIEIMDRYQLDPSWINLEITETASIKTRTILLKNMELLMDYGVRFSLDDFGNGESNLNYIVDMPVDIVKFDRDMTQAYFDKDKGRFVMRAARDMIHDLGLRIVAEGVETEEQFDEIVTFGVEYIQGYYFSKPLPKHEYIKFIQNRAGL